MQIFVRTSVCLPDEKCSRAHNIHLSLSGQSQVSLRSLSSYFIGQTEPKILRLVEKRSENTFSSLYNSMHASDSRNLAARQSSLVNKY